MTTKVIFVRHGEAEGNYERLFHGHFDSGLTDKGKIQAEKVAERLAGESIDIIYSSPLRRAYETARCIADKKNIKEIKTEEGLVEINGGEWENEKWDDLPIKWPEDYYNWENQPHLHCMPGGESMRDIYDRMVSTVTRIVDANIGKDICIVTHGTVLRVLMCYIHKKQFEDLISVSWYDNTAITIVEFSDNDFNIILEGDNTHLDSRLSTFATQDWWKKHDD